MRLYQGDYAQMTTYDADPVQVALRWQSAGASWLHLVDLDGAAQGHPVNTDLIGRIKKAVNLHIEVGGGMRSLDHVQQILDLGIDRIVLGTVAITNRALLQEALARYGASIIVGLDARDGQVAISGWRETSQIRAVDLVRELSVLGVQRIVYTDIARDGALSGPNFAALAEMREATTSALIASGGVSSLADLHALAQSGAEGAIVGKAIYTGDVDLAVAIREIERA